MPNDDEPQALRAIPPWEPFDVATAVAEACEGMRELMLKGAKPETPDGEAFEDAVYFLDGILAGSELMGVGNILLQERLALAHAYARTEWGTQRGMCKQCGEEKDIDKVGIDGMGRCEGCWRLC